MKSKSAIDWKTSLLVILASVIAILAANKVFEPESTLPEYRYIKNWQQLVDFSNSNTPIQIIEFYTYGCGFCNIFNEVLQNAAKIYPNKLSVTYKPIYFRTYDSNYHDAIAVKCAGIQNKFKVYHDLLFEKKSNYKKLALKAGINKMNKFSQCLEKRKPHKIIIRNKQIADSLGIKGVPFTIINGKGYPGSFSITALTAIIRKELKRGSSQ